MRPAIYLLFISGDNYTYNQVNCKYFFYLFISCQKSFEVYLGTKAATQKYSIHQPVRAILSTVLAKLFKSTERLVDGISSQELLRVYKIAE